MKTRMTVSLHLFPFLPLWVSFFLYGLCMGGVWHWWKSGNRGCLFVIIFWYALAVAIVFWWLSLSVQPKNVWGAFFVGVCIPYARRIWQHPTMQDTLYFFGRTWRFCVDMVGRLEAWNRSRRVWGAPPHEELPRQNTRRPHEWEGQGGSTDHGHDEAMRQEQMRREAEARARREQAERERQKEARKNEPPPRQESNDSRSPEEILGLKPPWTQDDLKTAYKREAGRTHPDKWIGKPEAIRQAMETEYKNIQEAYRRLKE